MSPVNLPDITRSTDLSRAQETANKYLDDIKREAARRATMTPEQQLAESLNTMFSQQPGEAWYSEGENWLASEHARWLNKANLLMEHFPDAQDRNMIISIFRGMR